MQDHYSPSAVNYPPSAGGEVMNDYEDQDSSMRVTWLQHPMGEKDEGKKLDPRRASTGSSRKNIKGK